MTGARPGIVPNPSLKAIAPSGDGVPTPCVEDVVEVMGWMHPAPRSMMASAVAKIR